MVCDGWKFPRQDFVFFHMQLKCSRKRWVFFVFGVFLMEKSPLYHFPRPVFCGLDILLGYDRRLTRAETLTNVRVGPYRVSVRTLHHTLTLLLVFFLDTSYWPQRGRYCCRRQGFCMTTWSWPDVVIHIMLKHWTLLKHVSVPTVEQPFWALAIDVLRGLYRRDLCQLLPLVLPCPAARWGERKNNCSGKSETL